jgi:cellulose synthase/poly-beta-1,6-N-acetylglucosamine synthase-like glycosyltransferase
LEEINHLKISVIIPTYNRINELENLLYSLNNQTIASSQFEIIVVDDGSSDGTEEWFMKHKDQFNVKILFYTQVHGGPGAARNLGMEKAHGDIFAFTDTDCIAEPEWLEHLTKPFYSEKVGAVGGREIINDKDPLLMRCFHYLMTSPLTTGGLRGKRGKKLAHFYPRTFNMAISRKTYNATEGFKKMFHAEDIELSYRIKKRGFDLIYEDSAKVYHRRRNQLTQFLKQTFNMGKARITLARLHPPSLELLHTFPALSLLFLFFLVLSSMCWHPASLILKLYLGLGLLYLIIVGINSTLKLHSFKAFFLIPLLFILQQGAYGSGFLASLLTRKEQKPT